jgi:acetyltransferase-like isoleucine patch superfamily enzyme
MNKIIYGNKYFFWVYRNFIKFLSFLLKSTKLKEFYYKSTYLRMLEFYRKKNVIMGKGTIFYSVTVSSSSKGDKFVVGKNCCLTGCTLLGHDASPATFINELVNKNQVYLPGSRSSYRRQITIGDNVFVGTNAIILPGISVGNNVVIGAGSVVVRDVESNSVVAGNPAKKITNIANFKEKYKILLKDYPNRF